MVINQPATQVFAANAKLLRARASKHAVIGTTIAHITVLVATVVATYLPDGDEITYANMLAEQKTNVVLEITETTIMADQDRAKEILDRLSEMDIRISIDDFGTGYSSLAYLKKLPVSEIKIDKSFVLEMDTVENDAVIVHATIQLGKNLSLHVVAEGVETEASMNKLDELGCDTLQGFFISKPLEAANFMPWLQDWKKQVA